MAMIDEEEMMYSTQRDFERSLQRSLIRRAQAADEERLRMFRQPLSAWLGAAAIAVLVLSFLLALKAVSG